MKGIVLQINKRRILSSFLFCLCGLVLWGAMMPNTSTPIESAVIGEAIRHGDESKPDIAFACNVFWGEEYLPSMLSTLEKEGVNITFFIGGTWAKENPDLLKTIVAGNHELGNHTYSHPHPTQITSEKNREQI
ncbi:MAG: polysaccharide deacetylase family protein, partial [Selenomonadales bacterium]|nr:polysaccharide deacetylase family protein [Selenomonadales bacterium]